MLAGTSSSPSRINFSKATGIEDDRTLSELLRRELSSNDAGHLRFVLRDLIHSHLAANQRIRELEANITALEAMAGRR